VRLQFSAWAALVGTVVVAEPSRAVVATRLAQPPVLDARADGPSWRDAPAIAGFRQWTPRENADPSFPTEFRVGYDARNLYVIVRAYDPSPDSIVRTVTRRDGMSASDEIGIYLDSNGDHRSGYEFFVNAAGVRRDIAISDDYREDVSWDAVWDAAVRIDSLGWTAEFRIPFSQLRFSAASTHSFGFLVERGIQRRAERVSWPAYYPTRTGVVSQFGILDGLQGIGESRSVEVAPFVRVQSRGAPATAAGADLRVGVASNVNVTATVLPDFGQVEADPSVVNLSSVETFYPEHRPFFLDGSGLYRASFNCTAFGCSNEGLFYSRRIGRMPQLASLYANGASDNAAPILAAAKLAGQMDGGVTVAALVASTGRLTSSEGRTLEPATTYGFARVQRDSRDGQSGASMLMTVVDRSLDSWSEPHLSRSAVVMGGRFRHRFDDGQYEVWGSTTVSRLAGSAPAIAEVQRDAAHYFQRPGSATPFDSTRTSLTGDQEEIAVGKYGGSLMFEAAFDRQSSGYDSNDLGYLQRADHQKAIVWIGYSQRRPGSFYTRWWANLNQSTSWNSAGTRLETLANTNAHIILTNNSRVNAGVTVSGIRSPVCDYCARGGPALRLDPHAAPYIDFYGDDRRRIVPELYIPMTMGDGGRSRSLTINPMVSLRLTSQLQASVGVQTTTNRDNTQWFGQFQDRGITRYTFAHIDQHTRSVTLRTSYAATPSLTLETYVAPFVSDGVYSDIRALSGSPLDAAYDRRFVSYTPSPTVSRQFGARQLRATSVLRWEYAPGSTVFVVWSQQRDATEPDAAISLNAGARELFGIRPVNSLTVKINFWLAR